MIVNTDLEDVKSVAVKCIESIGFDTAMKILEELEMQDWIRRQRRFGWLC